MTQRSVAIVGGGAAGLAAAISAAREAAAWGHDLDVCIYESADKIGRPLLATGNGRCNFTNAELIGPCVDGSVYYNADFVSLVLTASEEVYDKGSYPNPVQAFFADLGMLWRTEGEGRMYPVTGKATTVRELLCAACERLGVRAECEWPVEKLVPPEEGTGRWHLHARDGRVAHADTVIICCGGHGALQAMRKLPGDIPVHKRQDILGPLAVEEPAVRGLDTIRVRALVGLERDGEALVAERGEVLFRSYGVSGVCIFNLSRWAQPGDVLTIDLLPDLTHDQLETWLCEQKYRLESEGWVASVRDVLSGAVVPALLRAVCDMAGADEVADATKSVLKRLVAVLKRFELTVAGPGDGKQCQVSRGGVAVEALDAATLELLSCPGLYAAGEAIDVDAQCGGYNLHWAWSSGLVAGAHAARGAMGSIDAVAQ